MRLTVYRCRLPLSAPYSLSFVTLEAFDSFYIVADDGVSVGYGEATPLPGYGSETPESIETELFRLARTGATLEQEMMIDELVTRSPFLASGLVCALETLHEGPDVAFSTGLYNEIPLAAFCPGKTPKMAAEMAEQLTDEGYEVLKLKIGNASIEADLARIRAVAAVLPPSVTLRLDANQALDVEAAETLCRTVEELPVALLEQPFKPDQWDETGRLARSTSIPIMLDEAIKVKSDIDRAATIGVRMVKLKLCKHPGMAATRRLVEYVRACGLDVVLGNGVQSALGNHLEARVFTATRITQPAEINGFLKIKRSIFNENLSVRDGHLVDKGIELDHHSLPIRLTPMTATCRVPPLSRVKLGIGWSRGIARDAEQ